MLKDADNLDRVRLDFDLADMCSTDYIPELNPNYLRTTSSKTMLKLADELNSLYTSIINKDNTSNYCA